jgi:hypothetical protein
MAYASVQLGQCTVSWFGTSPPTSVIEYRNASIKVSCLTQIIRCFLSKYQVHVVARYEAELSEIMRELSDGRSMELWVSIQRIDISNNGVTHERVSEISPISCTEPEPSLTGICAAGLGSIVSPERRDIQERHKLYL